MNYASYTVLTLPNATMLGVRDNGQWFETMSLVKAKRFRNYTEANDFRADYPLLNLTISLAAVKITKAIRKFNNEQNTEI